MQTDYARTDVSAFPEMTGGKFSWERERQRLHREVPTAFWLEPGATIDLPDPVTAEPAPVTQSTDEPLPTRLKARGVAAGMPAAMLAAGPLFVLPMIVIDAVGRPALWGSLSASLMIVPFAMIFGVILSFLPILVGGLGMGWLGERVGFARRYSGWALAGGIMGAAIGVGFAGSAGLILVPTAILCALIARYWVRWDEVVDEAASLARTPAAIKA